MNRKLNILISPLNWGLGHASRIVPIIDYLIEDGHEVYIGGSGQSIEYLRKYYSDEKFVHVKSPNIKYGKKVAIGPGFAVSFVGFIKSIIRDYYSLKNLLKTHDFDIIISDNRPGFISKNTRSIYISHQINVKTRKPNRLSGKLVRKVHRYLISKFDYCIIPDNYGEISLAGELSEIPPSQKYLFAGPISRFMLPRLRSHEDKPKEILVLISGPEPHRTIFENLMLEKYANSSFTINLVRGVLNNGNVPLEVSNNVNFYNNPDDNLLYSLIKNSEYIFCRSGYSSLMDLAVCGRKAILIPTPGQPEQEYLAKRFQDVFKFEICSQSDISSFSIIDTIPMEKWEYLIEPEKLKKVLDLCLDNN